VCQQGSGRRAPPPRRGGRRAPDAGKLAADVPWLEREALIDGAFSG
jgi:hypothetical protein